MSLTRFEEIIKQKRKTTNFREYIKIFGSWIVLNFYKNNGTISRYPETERVKNLNWNFWEEASNAHLPFDDSV